MRTLAILLILCSAAHGQIAAERVYDPFEPIVLSVQDTAQPNQTVNALWTVESPAKSIVVSPTELHIWAPPRSTPYTVSTMVWVTQRVKIPQEDGTIVEGDLLIGPPRDYTATFSVAGSPTPIPPEPKPPGPQPEPEPEPEPEPTTPELPDDDFDNLAQRCADWATGLPNPVRVGGAYRVAAAALVERPEVTVNSVAAELMDALSKLDEFEAYTEFRRNVRTDLQQRWSVQELDKQEFSAYLNLVADGLEAWGE